MRVNLPDFRTRSIFLSLVFFFSLGLVNASGKAWLAEGWDASADPQKWQAAARLGPGNALYSERLGFFEEWDIERQNLPGAVKLLQLAVETDPRSATLHEELANIYEMKRDYVHAQDQ
jgi:hypothetical protein